eukprot:Gregarina_sp_Poly_1__5175@NODE_2742_length_1764_cov_1450_380082_g1736_i0_p1_GENE_NODE_2742_length_1764_cov_1450_380082_g1736_i0NODE_2742_length_1764_cov_1450_380082_g1736_i0_p1_ORF_typecomplete_len311_score27_02_NODE_2742_length_1764_cov_1450_380082_g1736_i01831115
MKIQGFTLCLLTLDCHASLFTCPERSAGDQSILIDTGYLSPGTLTQVRLSNPIDAGEVVQWSTDLRNAIITPDEIDSSVAYLTIPEGPDVLPVNASLSANITKPDSSQIVSRPLFIRPKRISVQRRRPRHTRAELEKAGLNGTSGIVDCWLPRAMYFEYEEFGSQRGVEGGWDSLPYFDDPIYMYRVMENDTQVKFLWTFVKYPTYIFKYIILTLTGCERCACLVELKQMQMETCWEWAVGIYKERTERFFQHIYIVELYQDYREICLWADNMYPEDPEFPKDYGLCFSPTGPQPTCDPDTCPPYLQFSD